MHHAIKKKRPHVFARNLVNYTKGSGGGKSIPSHIYILYILYHHRDGDEKNKIEFSETVKKFLHICIYIYIYTKQKKHDRHSFTRQLDPTNKKYLNPAVLMST